MTNNLQLGTRTPAVQIAPQKFSVSLRPGIPQTITINYKRAKGYPVDVYYLTDLSFTMRSFVQRLGELGEQLARTLRNITDDYALGFGSFVDKIVLPFAQISPYRKYVNPCIDGECAAPYAYRHQIGLTSDVDQFIQAVKSTKHSGRRVHD